MSAFALEVENLTKKYGTYVAVDRISFSIRPGEILGLLGANGAGKSTTIQMLLGLTSPDAGAIRYFGQDFYQFRESSLSRINYASAFTELQGRMTVMQNLQTFSGLYGVKNWQGRATELLQLLEIEDVANTIFWKLSTGQKTRTILAKSLLNKPKLLLMDEPTASLDPDIIQKIITVIKKLQEQEQIAILFTSHNMEEVARLCDRVAFLNHGKIVAIDSPAQLAKKVGAVTLSIVFEGNKSAIKAYLTKKQYVFTFVSEAMVEIQAEEEQVPAVLFGLKDLGILITNLQVQQPSLEDVFLHIAEHQRV